MRKQNEEKTKKKHSIYRKDHKVKQCAVSYFINCFNKDIRRNWYDNM